MTSQTCLDRLTILQASGFSDWNFPLSDEAAAQMLADHRRGIPRFPFYGAAFAELSGGLPDLDYDADDNAILELVRHGMTLLRLNVASAEEWMQARNAIYEEWAQAMREGAQFDQSLKEQSQNN